MRILSSSFALATLALYNHCCCLVESFSSIAVVIAPTTTTSLFSSSQEDANVSPPSNDSNPEEEQEDPLQKRKRRGGLILDQDEMQKHMSKLRSKYPTAEADYLAAARARSAAKLQSQERKATDQDWQDMAEQKKRDFGTVDDWENSQKEAGNADSQILIPMPSVGEDGEDGEEEEPKLMLF